MGKPKIINPHKWRKSTNFSPELKSILKSYKHDKKLQTHSNYDGTLFDGHYPSDKAKLYKPTFYY